MCFEISVVAKPIAFQVTGPTTPSALKPLAVCRAGKNSGKLNVNVYIKSFDDISGIYNMSVLYLYKEISGPQNGSTQNPHIHHHVLAGSAINAGAFGEEIFTNLSNGEVFHWSKTLDYNQNWDMSKIEIVFIVWKKTSTGFEFVNCTTN